MRGSVREAMQTSSAVARKAKKEEEVSKGKQQEAKPAQEKNGKTKADLDGESEEETKQASRARLHPKDFTTLSTSAPRRLNDIVQAPPEIKKLPRGAKLKTQTVSTSSQSLKDGVLSMAQKAMLEEERERAIRLYREMKQKNMAN